MPVCTEREKKKKNVDCSGWGGGKEWRGVVGMQIIVRMYCMEKKSLFSK